jgi:enoyl-CoA hydratase/carnithine racemase
MTDLVVFSEIAAQDGKKIGHASLNKASALNALNLEMIQLLTLQLLAWQQDPDIAVVLLDSLSDKAFCAGGDVVAMHNGMLDSPAKTPASLQTFFTQEYQLDHLIHTYSKPFLVWGHGIAMGGGVGLIAGGSHRIVTATSRFAMPEMSIGLYPDVGGSYFLNKMPAGCGLFLGLTGSFINGADALYVDLADYFIGHEVKADLVQALRQIHWQTESEPNHSLLTTVCQGFAADYVEQLPSSQLKTHKHSIDSVTQGQDVSVIVEQILQLEAADNKWLQRAQQSLKHGSPITAHLVFEQLKRGQHLSLAECLKMELVMSCVCGAFGEFQEGVRALLVDKDHQPAWRFKQPRDVPMQVIEQFFTSPWTAQQHPLQDL